LPGLGPPRPEIAEDATPAIGEELAPSGVIMALAVRGEAVQLARLMISGGLSPWARMAPLNSSMPSIAHLRSIRAGQHGQAGQIMQ
jgi:hypothetical protein